MMRDLETFSGFGGFFFQIVTEWAWQRGGAEGTMEDGMSGASFSREAQPSALRANNGNHVHD
jgi:hypothetical protein